MYQMPTSTSRPTYVGRDEPILHSHQLRLFTIRAAATATPRPADTRHGLSDIKAFAIDPEVENRRMAALSPMATDADLQLTLASDPDEQVVLNLLDNVDPHREANLAILAGPHRRARRELARRNLTTATLLTIVDDADPVVRRSARETLEQRGVLA